MSIWKGEPAAILVPSGQSKCKRCGKWFQPTSPDQEYGPICAKMIEKQQPDL